MDLHTWFLFAGVALIAIVSPGPAILLAVSNALSYDLKTVVFSSLGNVLGLFTLSSAAMLGLGVVLHTSAVLFLKKQVCLKTFFFFLEICLIAQSEAVQRHRQWQQSS